MFVEYGDGRNSSFFRSFYQVDIIIIFQSDKIGSRIAFHFVLRYDLDILPFVVVRIEDICSGDVFADSFGSEIIDSFLACFSDEMSFLVFIHNTLVYIFDIVPAETIVKKDIRIGNMTFSAIGHQIDFEIIHETDKIVFDIFKSGQYLFGGSLDFCPLVSQLFELFRGTDPFLLTIHDDICLGRIGKFDKGAIG